ncbi:hypothetical protein H4R19_002569, partial [Coemansia spiralis]
GNRDYERILLRFDLPPTLPRKCVLHIPAVVGGTQYNLTVTATDNSWDEATVDGANKAIAGFQIAAVEWPATAVDIKYPWDKSIGNKLGLFVDTVAYSTAFNSLQSGNNDVFVLAYLFLSKSTLVRPHTEILQIDAEEFATRRSSIPCAFHPQ